MVTSTVNFCHNSKDLIDMIVGIERLHRCLEISQVGFRCSIAAPACVLLEVWNHDSGQDAYNGHNDQQLNEGKTLDGARSFFHKGLPAVTK